MRFFRPRTAAGEGRRDGVVSDAQLNVYNIRAMRTRQPLAFDVLRFDSNNQCNVRCVYCHNHRTDDLIDRLDLAAFLTENVLSVNTFQVGCVMEPTLDARLCDLLVDVATSPAKPRRDLVLQTNGILLHRHDAGRFRDAGVSVLSLSIDSTDPAVMKYLRGGTSLNKILSNVERVRAKNPELKVSFVSTVTKVNVLGMESLVQSGLRIGVSHFVFREVFYHPENDMVDHRHMPKLVLSKGEFRRMATSLTAKFAGNATFEFADQTALEASDRTILSHSLRPLPK